MKKEFVKQPPHPETEWSACTLYSKNATEVKPLMDETLSDPSICVGPDGWYYLTGSTGDPQRNSSHGIMVWKSQDLSRWISIGLISDKAACAPEIHYIQNTFWIAYGMSPEGTGLLKSISGTAEGPYEDMGKITLDGMDASLFQEEDGSVYWVYGDGKIARLRDDLSGLAEEPHAVTISPWKLGGRTDQLFKNQDYRIGTHGAFLVKRNRKYFLFCAASFDRMGSESIDTFVAVSDSIYGPYSRRYLAIPHGGQATFYNGSDSDHKLYAAFAGCGEYSPVQNKPSVIPMEFPATEFIRPTSEVILEDSVMGRLRPKGDFPIRDTHICLGPDGTYYMTGTSNLPHQDFWNGNDELHLWTSQDTEDWKHLGKVWDLHIDGTWENVIRKKPCLWAPEICYIHGTFWITYSLKGGSTGLLQSVSGHAKGPYIDMGRMTNTDIDSSLFVDEDGQVYYVWQDGKIAKMKQDMSGFAEDPRKLYTVEGITVGYEGAFIVKYQGKYILGAAEWNGDERVDGTYDLMYAVSNHIYGPYSSPRVGVPHGGHGTMFIDKHGRLMSTLFGNDRTAPFRARPGVVALTYKLINDVVIIEPSDK